MATLFKEVNSFSSKPKTHRVQRLTIANFDKWTVR